ncbi:NAC domain-containing protein 41-like [Rosa rugosa]|uniref:NAC domain-containing protein 41-like n=1 Tax=Rosa rugosa TaxID=74645 RepID=UPI002B40ADCD|nr:NAC domain-containing protein 41-like [Rosa rugosa]
MATLRSRVPNRSNKQDFKNRSSTTNKSGLPVGVRFRPTDHELLDYYLHTKIAMGDHFHSDFVADFPDFYCENEPWVVWQIYCGGESKKVEDEKTLYFFTHRRRLSPTAKRFDRKVGSGTWSGQCSKEVVDHEDDGVVIGLKREFRYEGGCDSRHNEAWLMQEYQIIDDDSDIVLCTLRKNPRKAPPAQRSNVVEKTRVDDKKRKSIVDQPGKPKWKKQKKEESCDQEQEGSSTVDQMKVEETCYELDQDHGQLQVVFPYPFQDDQDCYYPELYPELCVDDKPDLFTIDELLGQTPTWYEGNNFNLVTGGPLL